MGNEDSDVLLERLTSGDRPSVYVVGLAAAKALKESGSAVLMADVLGRVHLLPAEFVEVKRRPKLSDAELHVFSEDEAIQLLVRQEEAEDSILAYLKRRALADVPTDGSREREE